MEKGEKMAEKIYKAAAYIRLSKKADDYMYEESESIESQRGIIESFVNGRDDMSLIEEFVDDGYSGTNFKRPGFQAMLDKIRRNEIDCVICKDLSRFGRNYIDCGVYLEKIFPFMGLRFISISEQIDSKDMTYGESVMIPFLNILNEEYSRDISRKIRSSLSAKRRAGDFVGAFAAYGYRKDPENHNKLIVDPETAETVKYIFRKRIEGLSNQAIAAELNQHGVLSPGEYAKAKGIKTHCHWQKRDKMIWDASTVKRVLENEIYVGTLVQGKTFKPTFRAEKSIPKPEEDWDRVENNHEAIVSVRDFNLVKKLLLMDTRVSPIHKAIYPLAGLIVCADCGYPMIRVKIPYGDRSGSYYRCGNYRKYHRCSSYNINSGKVEAAVFEAICERGNSVKRLQRQLNQYDREQLMQWEIIRLEQKVRDCQGEIEVNERRRGNLLEYQKDGLITAEECREFSEIYEKKTSGFREQIRMYDAQIKSIGANPDVLFAWMEDFTEFDDPQELSRYLAVRTVDVVKIAEKHVLDIHLNHEAEYQKICRYVKEKEAGIVSCREPEGTGCMARERKGY